MRNLIKWGIFAFLLCLYSPMQAQVSTEGPSLEYVCELCVTCDAAMTVGPTSHGTRVVIPITGGTFEGPRMRGTVVSGGADYQLVDRERGRTELEAIYNIRTDDGTLIHVRNRGLLCTGSEGFYFRTVPHFEAPADSPYDWLNRSVFVCVPEVRPDCISLKVWRVK